MTGVASGWAPGRMLASGRASGDNACRVRLAAHVSCGGTNMVWRLEGSAGGLAVRCRRGGILLLLWLVVGLLQSLVVAPHASAATCVGGSLQIVAHEDDDLLFMSPDILSDAMDGRCVRTVYVTAGDAGLPAEYWQARETGSEAAWAAMTEVANNWESSHVTAGGKTVLVRTLVGKPMISLVFLRLPNGDQRGQSFDHAGATLYGLAKGTLGQLTARDGSASYTRAELSATLLDLMRLTRPTLVRTQNYRGVYVNGGRWFDHYDHIAAASLALEASNAYRAEAPHRLLAYEGYPISAKKANVTGTPLARKSAAFDAYAVHDTAVIPNLIYNRYRWPARQYVVEETGSPVAASAGAAQSVQVGASVRLDAAGSSAAGAMTYAWTQTGGPAPVSLSDAGTAAPSFVPTVVGDYTFQVTVMAGSANSNASVTIAALGNGPYRWSSRPV